MDCVAICIYKKKYITRGIVLVVAMPFLNLKSGGGGGVQYHAQGCGGPPPKASENLAFAGLKRHSKRTCIPKQFDNT